MSRTANRNRRRAAQSEEYNKEYELRQSNEHKYLRAFADLFAKLEELGIERYDLENWIKCIQAGKTNGDYTE